MSSVSERESESQSANDFDEPLELIRRALAGLRFGSVEIVVHDSRIVQIERREKVRLPASETHRK